MVKQYQGINSKAVHAGEQPDPNTGTVIPPIYQTSTFSFATNQDMFDFMAGKKEGYIYTRINNPNFQMVEDKIAQLEGSEAGLIVSSGMMATTIALLSLAGSGNHIISHADLYGGTFGLMHELLPTMGLETTFVDPRNHSEVENAVKENTRLIFLETPSNPSLRIYDLEAISALAHRKGIKVVVDNTFATPYNQKPLEVGADLVTHSCTKYLNGHSDLIAGAILGASEQVHLCKDKAKVLGGTLNGIDAWMLMRGLKTLGLRVKQQNLNGQEIAEFLESHPRVKKVYYPGLPDHEGHEIARKQMKGFGGVLSFELEGSQEDINRFLDRVELATRGVSLGSVETLITQPVAGVHYSVPPEYRRKGGIKDNLIRLSAGIEESEDIIADLKQALM